MRKTARILSIDGGGIRGLIPAIILNEWEKQIGSIKENFHMIAGTSTGGILACATSQGIKGSALIDLYKKNGPKIFEGSFTTLGGIASQLYDANNLVNVVKDVLKGSLSEIQNDLLVTSYNIEARQPFLFKSWKARGYELDTAERAEDSNFQLVDVARATSAAPTYFTPALVKNQKGKTFPLIDGGVYANNPAMCAYVAARRIYPKADEYLIVSLGTGGLTKPIQYQDALNYGLAGWLRPLLDIMFDGVASTTEYELANLPGVSQFRFQTSLVGASEAMDDVSPENLSNLVKVTEKMLKARDNDTQKLVKRLKEKKTSLKDLGYPTMGVPPKPMTEITQVPKTNGEVITGLPSQILNWILD